MTMRVKPRLKTMKLRDVKSGQVFTCAEGGRYKLKTHDSRLEGNFVVDIESGVISTVPEDKDVVVYPNAYMGFRRE